MTTPALGNITNKSSPGPLNGSNGGLNRADRRALRIRSRRLLQPHTTLSRVRACGHYAVGNMVSLRVGETGADYGRLMTCGSVWACPVCSARILFERTRDVATAIDVWEGRRGRLAMVTLTVRHKRSDSLKDVWALVGKAWGRVTSGKRWATVKADLGLAGWLRTTEVTHGENGWHVHLHVLLFLEDEVSEATFAKASGSLVERWTSAVSSLGGSALNDVQDARLLVNAGTEVAAYLAKQVFQPDDLALELTRGDLKVGAGRSPFQILADAQSSGDAADWELWREYEQASFRKRQQTWSQGFRKGLDLGEVRSDEEIAADDELEDLGDAPVQTVLWLPLESWRAVRGSDYLYYGLLDAAVAGHAVDFLEANGLEWIPPEEGWRWYAGKVA